tara:strand:- start:9146 stop:10168 length:1023 start_codon:yes stop_codon:yes gene_type:complete
MPDLLQLCIIPVTALSFGIFFRYFKDTLLDHPNSRSSHSISKSRAGGILFGLPWLLVAGMAAILGLPLFQSSAGFDDPTGKSHLLLESGPSSWWFLLGAFLIWLNGLLDDLHQLPAKYRIVMQALGVAAGILGPEEFRESLHPLLLLLVLVGLVYFVNVFNFMDGTDGLAASQGIFLLVGGFLLAYSGLAFQLLAISLSIFLFWNLPRSRLFMGDSGSNLVGYVTGFLLLKIFLENPALAFLLPVLFTADTTLTLLLRIFRGQMFYQAHREHGYQHLAGKFGHGAVLLIFSILNALVLAAAFCLERIPGLYQDILLVSVVHILAAVWFYFCGAGRPRTDF